MNNKGEGINKIFPRTVIRFKYALSVRLKALELK